MRESSRREWVLDDYELAREASDIKPAPIFEIVALKEMRPGRSRGTTVWSHGS